MHNASTALCNQHPTSNTHHQEPGGGEPSPPVSRLNPPPGPCSLPPPPPTPPSPGISTRGTHPINPCRLHPFLLPRGKPKNHRPLQPLPAEPARPNANRRPRNPHHQPAPDASFLPTRGTAAPCPRCARLLISPRRSLTYTLQRPSSAPRSPPYPGVNQKLTHPRNPCRLHPLHLRALTFTLHHTPQHQGRAPPSVTWSVHHTPPSNTPPPAEPAPPTRAGCHLILLRTLQSPHNTSSPLPLLFSYPEVNHHPPCNARRCATRRPPYRGEFITPPPVARLTPLPLALAAS